MRNSWFGLLVVLNDIVYVQAMIWLLGFDHHFSVWIASNMFIFVIIWGLVSFSLTLFTIEEI